MFHLLGQLFQPDNEIGVILQTLFSFAFIIYIFYAQRIQAMTMLRQIEGTLRRIKHLRDESRRTSLNTIREIGKPSIDPTPMVERFMEHFLIIIEKVFKVFRVYYLVPPGFALDKVFGTVPGNIFNIAFKKDWYEIHGGTVCYALNVLHKELIFLLFLLKALFNLFFIRYIFKDDNDIAI